MARIKLAYIGGDSTRAAGIMASFVHQGENFDGSEVVLIDLNEEHLRIVQSLAFCRFEPVIGLLFTALEAAGGVVDGALLDKLIPTLPDQTLFSTIMDYSIS